MAINFPSSPTNGQLYTFGQNTWQWTGQYWSVYSAQTGYVTNVSSSGGGSSVVNSFGSNSLVLKTFSGGSNVIITDNGNQLTFSSTGGGGSGVDTYVTGFTYNNVNGELTILQNQGQPPLSVTVSTISTISLFNYYNFI